MFLLIFFFIFPFVNWSHSGGGHRNSLKSLLLYLWWWKQTISNIFLKNIYKCVNFMQFSITALKAVACLAYPLDQAWYLFIKFAKCEKKIPFNAFNVAFNVLYVNIKVTSCNCKYSVEIVISKAYLYFYFLHYSGLSYHDGKSNGLARSVRQLHYW